jgi:excisionase family DNA binding protein
VKEKPLTPDSDHEILTTTELAAFLRCNKSTIYKLANAGELPGFKLGSDWRFPVREITQWLSKSSNANRLERPNLVSYSKRGKRHRAL